LVLSIDLIKGLSEHAPRSHRTFADTSFEIEVIVISHELPDHRMNQRKSEMGRMTLTF